MSLGRTDRRSLLRKEVFMNLSCESPNLMRYDAYQKVWQFVGPLISHRDECIVFDRISPLYNTGYKIVPCGNCISCKLRHARDWQTRITAESSLYRENYAITLTYNDDNLPMKEFPTFIDVDDFGEVRSYSSVALPTLNYDHVQLFKKALLEDLRRHGHVGVRFFAAGEYGAKNLRPHYHLIMMNLPLNDLKFWKTSDSGIPIYRSHYLEQFWQHGFVSVQYSNEYAAGYVARYTLKKIRDLGKDLGGLVPEFVHMSNRPGIGAAYCQAHRDQIIKNDSIYLNGKKLPVPAYFEDMCCTGNLTDMLKVAENCVKRRERSDSKYSQFLKDLTVPYQQWHDEQIFLIEGRSQRLIRPL